VCITVSGFGGIVDAYKPFHMAWTGVWMLRWLRTFAADETRILPYVSRLGDWLLSVQNDTGCIPGWFNSTTLEPIAPLQTVNAETAGSALFLAELYAQTGQSQYLNGALAAMQYIEREIIPTLQWFDFETFYSCSPKPLDFYDWRTRQYLQNNLGKIQAPLAYLRLYQITGNQSLLDLGTRTLDYLLLTQQVSWNW